MEQHLQFADEFSADYYERPSENLIVARTEYILSNEGLDWRVYRVGGKGASLKRSDGSVVAGLLYLREAHNPPSGTFVVYEWHERFGGPAPIGRATLAPV